MSNLAYEQYVCPSPNNLYKMMLQPKVYLALAISVPCGLTGAGLKIYQDNVDAKFMASVITDETAYSMLSLLVVFVAAFRIDTSYLKFWAGCSYVYNIGGSLFDGASDIIAYTRGASADPDTVREYQHLIVRLVSLLHVLICDDLEKGAGRFDRKDERSISYELELLDANSIDDNSLKKLCMSENKVEYAFQWIQNVCVEMWNKNVFGAEAPVVARVFEDVGDGLVHFHEGQKITEVPFPFPYTISLQILLITHYLVTPLVIVSWSNYALYVGVFSTAGTFSIWLFVGLAIEMDLPFSYTKNSLSMQYMQRLLNYRLLTLLDTFDTPTPSLVSAKTNLNRRSMKRGAEVGVSFAKASLRINTIGLITGEA